MKIPLKNELAALSRDAIEEGSRLADRVWMENELPLQSPATISIGELGTLLAVAYEKGRLAR